MPKNEDRDVAEQTRTTLFKALWMLGVLSALVSVLLVIATGVLRASSGAGALVIAIAALAFVKAADALK